MTTESETCRPCPSSRRNSHAQRNTNNFRPDNDLEPLVGGARPKETPSVHYGNGVRIKSAQPVQSAGPASRTLFA